jgi:tetratricopeptide (TPR) repeat protein
MTECPFCKAPAPRRDPPKGGPAKCSACGRLINPSLAECPFCKAKLAPSAPPQSSGLDYAGIAEASAEHNKKMLVMDFSPASVFGLDIFFDEMWGTEGYARDKEDWTATKGQTAVIMNFGCYFGEVMRRRYGARWLEDPNQPGNPLWTTIDLPGGQRVFAIAKVFKRLKNGSEDALYPLLLHVRHQQKDPLKAEELPTWLAQAAHLEGVKRHDHALKCYDCALALPLTPEDRARVTALREKAASAEAARAGEATPPTPVTGESLFAPPPSAKPAPDFAEGVEQLATVASLAGILLDHSPASLAALDVWMDHLVGREPLSDEQKEKFKFSEWSVGCYLGEMLCAKYGASWRPDAEHPDCSHVAWPSGFVTCPFVYPSKRMERGTEYGIYKQFLMLLQLLTERGEAPPAHDETDEWMRQAETYERQLHRQDLAVSFARKALQFRPGSVPIHSRIGDFIAGVADQREKALPWYDKALSLDPSFRPAWLGKASVFSALGRYPEALACLEKGLEAGSENAAQLVLQGDVLRGLGRPSEAVVAYTQAAALDDKLLGAHLGAATCLEGLGNLEGAAAELGAAMKLPGCPTAACFHKGEIEERLGRSEEALGTYKQALNLAGLNDPVKALAQARVEALENTPEKLKKKAGDLAGAGKMKEAVETYQRILQLTPEDAEAWRETGVGLSLMGNLDEALKYFDRAIALQPSEPKSYDHKAVSLGRLKRFAEGLQVLEQGLYQSPGAGQLLKRRGIFLMMSGQAEAALASLDQALAAAPDDSETHFYKAGAFQKTGNLAEAARELQTYCDLVPAWRSKMAVEARKMLWGLQNPGKQLQPDIAAQYADRAFARLGQGDLQGGLADLDESLKANPFSGEAWLNRGTCLSRLGRLEEALSSYNHAHELMGGLAIILQNKAAVLTSLLRWDEAMVCHDEVLKASPKDDDSLRGKAGCLEALNRREEALGYWERFLQVHPRSADGLSRKADCLRNLKRFEEALAVCDEVIALDPQNKHHLLVKSLVLSDMGRSDEAFELQSQAFSDKKFADEWDAQNKRLLNLLMGDQQKPEE